MALPLYLAMTAAEIQGNSPLPERLGYMACHFSPYGVGLCNCPTSLREDSLIIVNDRIPFCGHDPDLIAAQLAKLTETFSCRSVLLDLQRPGAEEAGALTKLLVDALPCPVCVSEQYAGTLNCPVFLPPAPLDVPLEEYLSPWLGREVWLESALDGLCLTLTETGCAPTPLPYPALRGGFQADHLHCHYSVEVRADAARFSLWRSWEDLSSLLAQAESLGVTQAVGLWQELGAVFCKSSESP